MVLNAAKLTAKSKIYPDGDVIRKNVNKPNVKMSKVAKPVTAHF